MFRINKKTNNYIHAGYHLSPGIISTATHSAAARLTVKTYTPPMVAVRENAWGLLPLFSLIAAISAFTMAAATVAARFEYTSSNLLFWLSLLILFVPITFRLLLGEVSRREGLGLVILLGMGLYAVAVLINRPGLVNFDEMLHWRTANDIVQSDHLFTENNLLPASPYYPGLEILTVMLVKLTGLPIMTIATFLLGVSRLILVMALYLIYERISQSVKIAGLAAVLFMTNANFLYFSPQYAYEGLAMPLALLGLYAIVVRNHWANRAKILLGLSLLIFGAAITTHHLTMYLFSIFSVLWILVALLWKGLQKLNQRRDLSAVLQKRLRLFAGLIRWLRDESAREPQKPLLLHRPVLLVTLFVILVSAGYTVFVATPTIPYLAGASVPGFGNFFDMLSGDMPGRTLFQDGTGTVAPKWEQLCSLGATFFTVLGLGLGLPYLWRHFRNDALSMTLGIAAICFPFSLAMRLNYSTWEISVRLSTFLMVGVAFVFVVGVIKFHSNRISDRAKNLAIGGVMTFIFVGGVIAGTPRWSRLPGPYLASADPRSIEPKGLTTAEWAKDNLGEDNRFMGDRINGVLMGSLGMQRMVYKEEEEGQQLVYVFFAPEFDFQAEKLIRYGQLDYVIIDHRLTTMLPLLGFYYQSDEPREPTDTMDVQAQDKFDDHAQINRIFDNGDIVIYDTTRVAEDAP